MFEMKYERLLEIVLQKVCLLHLVLGRRETKSSFGLRD